MNIKALLLVSYEILIIKPKKSKTKKVVFRVT